MWISLTQQPLSVLPALLREMLDLTILSLLGICLLIFSDFSLPFSVPSNYLLLIVWTGQISFITSSEALKWVLLLKTLGRR